MDKISSHSILHSRPNFVSSLNEFTAFLMLTSNDLNAKLETLKSQKKILRQNRTAKHYLSCQIYMMKKHIKRLDRFNVEIEERLSSALKEDLIKDADGNDEKECEKELSCIESGNDESCKETFRESAIDCGDLEANASNCSGSLKVFSRIVSGDVLDTTLSSDSVIDDSLRYDISNTTTSICSSNNETASECDKNDRNVDIKSSSHKESDDEEEAGGDSSTNSHLKNTESKNITSIQKTCQDGSRIDSNSVDKELQALLADMKKMKRRCKHVLDVTDKYCVLNNETDLKLDLKQSEAANLNESLSKSPTTSPWSTRCSSVSTSNSELFSSINSDDILTSEDEVDGSPRGNKRDTTLRLPVSISDRGLLKVTLNSFGEHIAVLIKTYTRRHA